jgi:membrane associated rhomboid family serine protease
MHSIWSKSATKNIIIANCMVFILFLLIGNLLAAKWPSTYEMIVYNLACGWETIADFKLWTLLTCTFLHADFMHIFFNMLILYFTGILVEKRIGNREFLKFYLLAGMFASLCFAIFGNGISVGASGAVSGSVILAACLMPKYKVYLFGVLPMTMLWIGVLFVALDVTRAIGGSAGNVAVEAHLGGAAFGVLWYMMFFRNKKSKPTYYSPYENYHDLDI